MTKKGPLSKKEKSYIEENKNVAIEELAEKLDRSEASINKHIATLKDDDKPQSIAGQQFARNEKYGATIMTENASMAGDATKGHRIPEETEVNVARRHRGSIHKIKGD
jgi:hypothetical protein|tara:strand:+ start:1224 stop:1547 length:324 start_codon:yes stop_codon:yes gene_type:complete